MPSTAMSSPRRPSTPGRVKVARASPPAMSTSALAVDPASDKGRAFPVPVTSSDRLPSALTSAWNDVAAGGRGGGRGQDRRRIGQRGGLGRAAARGQEQDHGGERRGRAKESGHGASVPRWRGPVKRGRSSDGRRCADRSSRRVRAFRAPGLVARSRKPANGAGAPKDGATWRHQSMVDRGVARTRVGTERVGPHVGDPPDPPGIASGLLTADRPGQPPRFDRREVPRLWPRRPIVVKRAVRTPRSHVGVVVTHQPP